MLVNQRSCKKYNKLEKYTISKIMWVGRVLIKVAAEIAEDLYNLYEISLILSIGSVQDSLRLIELLDEEEGL